MFSSGRRLLTVGLQQVDGHERLARQSSTLAKIAVSNIRGSRKVHTTPDPWGPSWPTSTGLETLGYDFQDVKMCQNGIFLFINVPIWHIFTVEI